MRRNTYSEPIIELELDVEFPSKSELKGNRAKKRDRDALEKERTRNLKGGKYAFSCNKKREWVDNDAEDAVHSERFHHNDYYRAAKKSANRKARREIQRAGEDTLPRNYGKKVTSFFNWDVEE
jgi:hypothetical protein